MRKIFAFQMSIIIFFMFFSGCASTKIPISPRKYKMAKKTQIELNLENVEFNGAKVIKETEFSLITEDNIGEFELKKMGTNSFQSQLDFGIEDSYYKPYLSTNEFILGGTHELTLKNAILNTDSNIKSTKTDLGWDFDFIITIPLLKLTAIKKENEEGTVLAETDIGTIGLGINFRKKSWLKGDIQEAISISPALLISKNSQTDASGDESVTYDPAIAIIFGVLGNKLQFGLGYDLGEVSAEQNSKFFVLFGAGGSFGTKK